MKIKRRKLKLTRTITLIIAMVIVAIIGLTYKEVQDKRVANLKQQIESKQAEIEELKEIEEERIKFEAEVVAQEDLNSDASILQDSSLTMEERIQRYLGTGISKFGMIYYDLTTGEELKINENKVFTAASTYKVGMDVIAYEEVKRGNLSTNTKIQYIPGRDYEGGSGILQNQMDTTLNSPIELEKLIELSITHSDNIASKMIFRTLGGISKVRERVNDMVGLTCETKVNVTTPEIQYRLLKHIYENKDDENYANLIEYMKNTVFHDRIDKYLPYEIVAHKIGNYGAAVNDIGIVFTDKPYILVTYSEGLIGSAEKIAKISEMIYKEQLKK